MWADEGYAAELHAWYVQWLGQNGLFKFNKFVRYCPATSRGYRVKSLQQVREKKWKPLLIYNSSSTQPGPLS